ncbi:hypothetical protein GCM10018966_026180 [Streptomyces yanii]
MTATDPAASPSSPAAGARPVPLTGTDLEAHIERALQSGHDLKRAATYSLLDVCSAGTATTAPRPPADEVQVADGVVLARARPPAQSAVWRTADTLPVPVPATTTARRDIYTNVTEQHGLKLLEEARPTNDTVLRERSTRPPRTRSWRRLSRR